VGMTQGDALSWRVGNYSLDDREGLLMGYIDKNLIDGEHIVYKTTKHWTVFFWPLFFMLLLYNVYRSVGGPILLALVWLLPTYVDFRTSEFGLTNRRIVIKSGFVRRLSLETFLDKIEGVSVQQGLWGRILGYGTITFIGVGGTKNSFRRINKPLELAREVQEKIPTPTQYGVNVG